MSIDLCKSTPTTPLRILELTANDVERLRLGFWSRLSESDVKRVVAEFPGLSVWIPDSLEYAIAAPWRHRQDVVTVLALSAARHPAELLNSVARNAARRSAKMVISIEIDEVRHPAFYARAGFDLLEEVIAYELDSRNYHVEHSGRLTFRRIDPANENELALLVQLDHATFPWLWRNSAEEFLAYANEPGVELFIGYHADEPMCYAGITAYLGWGHIDRIAVVPDKQGFGFGKDALGFVIERLTMSGAARIGLSTQVDNLRSQQLYERFGFRRGTQNGYHIYGMRLGAADEIVGG